MEEGKRMVSMKTNHYKNYNFYKRTILLLFTVMKLYGGIFG